jgi:hypothetical protein
MNAPVDAAALARVSLDDKYTLEKGRVFLTGTQALIRLLLLQRERDQRAGLNTAGFVSLTRADGVGDGEALPAHQLSLQLPHADGDHDQRAALPERDILPFDSNSGGISNEAIEGFPLPELSMVPKHLVRFIRGVGLE